jgi:hypothetical protein
MIISSLFNNLSVKLTGRSFSSNPWIIIDSRRPQQADMFTLFHHNAHQNCTDCFTGERKWQYSDKDRRVFQGIPLSTCYGWQVHPPTISCYIHGILLTKRWCCTILTLLQVQIKRSFGCSSERRLFTWQWMDWLHLDIKKLTGIYIFHDVHFKYKETPSPNRIDFIHGCDDRGESPVTCIQNEHYSWIGQSLWSCLIGFATYFPQVCLVPPGSQYK